MRSTRRRRSRHPTTAPPAYPNTPYAWSHIPWPSCAPQPRPINGCPSGLFVNPRNFPSVQSTTCAREVAMRATRFASAAADFWHHLGGDDHASSHLCASRSTTCIFEARKLPQGETGARAAATSHCKDGLLPTVCAARASCQ